MQSRPISGPGLEFSQKYFRENFKQIFKNKTIIRFGRKWSYIFVKISYEKEALGFELYSEGESLVGRASC